MHRLFSYSITKASPCQMMHLYLLTKVLFLVEPRLRQIRDFPVRPYYTTEPTRLQEGLFDYMHKDGTHEECRLLISNYALLKIIYRKYHDARNDHNNADDAV